MSFLQKSGTKFTLNSSPFYIFGCTVYNDLYWFNGLTPFTNKIASVVTAGYNTIRFTNYMNVAADANIEYASYVWNQVDACLDLCRQNNIKVILELSEAFGIFHARNTWASAPFYTDAQNYINWLTARVNTINGRTYKNDDTIAMYSIAGELGEPAYPTGNGPFYTTISGYIRAQDTNHLICPGGQNPEQIYDTTYQQNGSYISEDILNVSSVDCAATEGYYTENNEIRLYYQIGSYSQKRNKPWFIIEFGFDQAYFTDAQRASRYQFIFQQALKYGAAGVIFWNFDTGIGSGYGVSSGTPMTYALCTKYASIKNFIPRSPIDSGFNGSFSCGNSIGV